MKLAISFCVLFSSLVASAKAEPGIQVVGIPVTKKATAQIVVFPAKEKLATEFYLRSASKCTKTHFRTLTCLDLHTAGKDAIVQVPVSLVDLTDEDEFAGDLAKIGRVAAKKEKRSSYDWGFVSFWTVSGSHFFYMIPENRTYGVRIGPIDDSVLANFDFQFEHMTWDFKD